MSIEQTVAEPYKKPLPEQTPRNAPFWQGLREHAFKIPKCNACGTWNWVPLPNCRGCLSDDLTWTATPGSGRLFSYTIIHRGLGAFNADGPYAVVLVELDLEGPGSAVVMGNVVGIANSDLKIGMPMKIAYEDIEGEEVALWRFTKGDER